MKYFEIFVIIVMESIIWKSDVFPRVLQSLHASRFTDLTLLSGGILQLALSIQGSDFSSLWILTLKKEFYGEVVYGLLRVNIQVCSAKRGITNASVRHKQAYNRALPSILHRIPAILSRRVSQGASSSIDEWKNYALQSSFH